MPPKSWTVTTEGPPAVTRTLTHEQMISAMFEAVHGFGFEAPGVAEQAETHEPVRAAA
jgi:hypothetical protein